MGKNESDCDREMVKSLDLIPYGKIPKWGETARFLIITKQKLGLGVRGTPLRGQKKKSKKELSNGWAELLSKELHFPVKRKFLNFKGIKYLLMLIDVFSKYGGLKPLKDKKGQTAADALNEIFKSSKRIPKSFGRIREANFLEQND